MSTSCETTGTMLMIEMPRTGTWRMRQGDDDGGCDEDDDELSSASTTTQSSDSPSGPKGCESSRSLPPWAWQRRAAWRLLNDKHRSRMNHLHNYNRDPVSGASTISACHALWRWHSQCCQTVHSPRFQWHTVPSGLSHFRGTRHCLDSVPLHSHWSSRCFLSLTFSVFWS